MVSNKDLEDVVAQVNKAYERMNKRITALEEAATLARRPARRLLGCSLPLYQGMPVNSSGFPHHRLNLLRYHAVDSESKWTGGPALAGPLGSWRQSQCGTLVILD